MTETEKKRLRHLLARFEGVRHNSVEIIQAESFTGIKRKVYAKIRGFKFGYVFENDNVVESWAVV